MPILLSEQDVAHGAHVCAVGACRPDQREMDTALVTRGRMFVDSRAGALVEAGDPLIPMKEGAFGGSIFKSLGIAVEDVAAAHLAYLKAAERGLGRGFVL